jgi:hypothetical protein
MLIPLRDASGFGLGRIARVSPGGGVLLGYFFDRAYTRPPSLSQLAQLESDDAALVTRFGDSSLIRGEWRTINGSESWDRNKWRMPKFTRKVEHDGKAWLVEYDQDDPNSNPRETPLSLDDARKFPDNSLFGAGALELRLTRLISSRN